MDTTDISTSCRVLGALFYLPPTDAAVAPFLDLIVTQSLPLTWPCGSPAELAHVQSLMAQDLDADRLASAYQRLFIGPDHLEAPPWGSVYLSEDGTLCADSLLDLRAFLDSQQIRLDTHFNEPEDHIGLLFWTAAALGDQQRAAALAELLHRHILPWSSTYLTQLATASAHPFYAGLSQLATLTLDALGDTLKQS
ncbi:MAG: Tat proofreading chaperone DmsD [Rhodocyclaceae bacterium]